MDLAKKDLKFLAWLRDIFQVRMVFDIPYCKSEIIDVPCNYLRVYLYVSFSQVCKWDEYSPDIFLIGSWTYSK